MRRVLIVILCCVFSLSIFTGCFPSPKEETPSPDPSEVAAASIAPSPSPSANPSATPIATVLPTVTPSPSSLASTTKKPRSKTSSTSSDSSTSNNHDSTPMQESAATSEATPVPTPEPTPTPTPTPTPDPTPDRREEYEAELFALELEYNRTNDEITSQMQDAYVAKRLAMRNAERTWGNVPENVINAIENDYQNAMRPLNEQKSSLDSWYANAKSSLKAKYGY